MVEHKYKAFISYSHKDRKWASWLHRRLEAYSFPHHAVGQATTFGPVPKNLKPIFRDRDELAAADNLGDKIEAALKASENLIIICSPDAAASHWVNQEVLFFKRHNRGAKIFSVIVDGEPFADGKEGAVECLPEALRFAVGDDGALSSTPAEPLAADMRPEGDGKRLGTLKLISGMVGLGLDDLVQRDLARARKRVTAITAGAFATVLAMGTLTWFAMDARQEAEARRADAEGIIEFMLTDLRADLEPVGRLDTLESVADRAIKYYNVQDIAPSDCGATGRFAQALQFSSELKYDAGNLKAGADLADHAFAITENRLSTCRDADDALINHADSIYYKGFDAAYEGDMARFEDEIIDYQKFVDEYCDRKPKEDKCPINKAYAFINLGAIALNNEPAQLDLAETYFLDAIRHYEKSKALANGNFKVSREHANAHGWLADTYLRQGKHQDVVSVRQKERELYDIIRIRRQGSLAKSELQLARDIAGARLGEMRGLMLQKKISAAVGILDSLLVDADELTTADPKNKEYQIFKLWVLSANALILDQMEEQAESCAAKVTAESYQSDNELSTKTAPRFAQRLGMNFQKICNEEN